MGNKCGDLGMHWYHSGSTCECGQIPEDIFFAASCSCGAFRVGLRKPVHSPDCASIAWAKKRTEWIQNNQVDPPINPIPIRASEHYMAWNAG